MPRQICTPTLQVALWITLLWALCSWSAARAGETQICLLATRQAGTFLEVYSLADSGRTRLLHSFALKEFAQNRQYQTTGGGFSNGDDGMRDAVRLWDVTVSTKLHYLACRYFFSEQNTPGHDEIRVYDLARGTIIATLLKTEPTGDLAWCGWKDDTTLLVSEIFLGDKQIHCVHVDAYRVDTRVRTRLRTTRMLQDIHPDPDGYFNRAAHAAEDFNRLGLETPPLSSSTGTFAGNFFGGYRSNHNGDVSKTGRYAVARTWVASKPVYVLLRDGKRVAQILSPYNWRVGRVKLLEGILLAECEDARGVHTIEIYASDTGKHVASLPGQAIVDE